MRKPIALLFAAALVLGLAGMANAQQTYTWTLIEGPQARHLWPNEANSPNVFEADGGLLGRVVTGADPAQVNASCTALDTPYACCTGLGTGICNGLGGVTDPAAANACELAPSYDCAAGNPPVFLLPAGTAEGGPGAGGGDECNRKALACGHTAPGAFTPATDNDEVGEYSYLVIHTAAQGTNPAGKGIGFFNGTFVQTSQPFVCNDCPPIGKGHDDNNAASISNTTIGSVTQTLSSSLWLTQSTPPFGHAQVSLAAGGAGAGEASVCGTGLTYQDLNTDLCVDGLSGTGNFQIPDQKTVSHNYSVTFLADDCKGNGPDCYIQNVIIPAALAQNTAARNVQVLAASSILPGTAPGSLANASVDSLLFMYTTQAIDMDSDGTQDCCDPCPNDPSDSCTFDLINSVTCPAGQVFCADNFGDLGCLDAASCNTKGDLNNDCLSDTADSDLLAGTANGVGGAEVFNTGLSVGPFDP